MITTTDNRKLGRTPGRQHDRVIHVRLPSPAVKALKVMASDLGISVSRLVRAGVDAKLAELVPTLVELSRDETASPAKRLRAMKMLRQLTIAELYMGPMGLKIARAKVMEEHTSK